MKKTYIPSNQIGLFEYLTQEQKELEDLKEDDLDQQEIPQQVIKLEDIPRTDYESLIKWLYHFSQIQINRESDKVTILFDYTTNKGYEKLRIVVYEYYFDKKGHSNTFLHLNFHPKISYVYDTKMFKDIYECINGIKEHKYNGPNEIGEGYHVKREETHTIREVEDKELLDYE